MFTVWSLFTICAKGVKIVSLILSARVAHN